MTTDTAWPALPYDAWKDTYATLHMWTQVVGKVALALAPPLNHSWAIAMQVTPRGLATRRLVHGPHTFAMEFDFIDHDLVIRRTDLERRIPLEPQTVARFYERVMTTLREMDLAVDIWPMPVEIPSPIRFDRDEAHHHYDPELAHRCWRILARIEEVFTRTRSTFVGKCSPAHFFWGAFDLAITRFSGRLAPPREGPAFMREAYSHEVISHGFWPGSGPILEPTFYAYAVPEPAGLRDAKVQPDAAFYHQEMGEFVLPYEAVRTSPSPELAIQQFINSTYERAATLAGWDRRTLERQPVQEAAS